MNPSGHGPLRQLGRRLETGLLVVLLAVMILVAVAQIVLRKTTGSGFAWADEFLRLAVLWIALVVFNPILDVGLSTAGVTAASIGMVLLALSFGSLALMIGALTGKRSLAVGVAAGAALATFFINGLAPLIDSIAWTQRLTPFYWLLDHNPLVNGFQWQLLVLVAIVAAFVGVSVWGFRRRDVTV